MSKKILFLLLTGILVLGGAGCGEKKETPANENANQNVNQGVTVNTNISSPEASGEIVASSGEQASGNEGIKFVEYTNKSLSYKIMRPNGWYWQHFIQKEIDDMMPGVIDLFVTDPAPSNDFISALGRVVIEASNTSLNEVANSFSDLTSSDATVGGISATKYEGTRESQKIIAYLFQKDNVTYTIVYTKLDSTAEDEAVFAKLIESFSF